MNLYVSMFWQNTNFQLWGSMCQRPLLRTFTNERRGQGNRKWSTVRKELFVSRCISEIRFFFWKSKVHCRVHKCPSTGLNSETLECPSHFTPCFSKFSHQFLGLPVGLLSYGPDQNCVWTLHASSISSFLRTHRKIKELCSSSWSSFTGSLTSTFRNI